MRLALLVGAVLAIGSGYAGAETPFEVLVADARYPEGPLFIGERLIAADMGQDAVFDLTDDVNVVYAESGCGPTSIAAYGSGVLVLCHLKRELVLVDGAAAAVRRWSRSLDGRKLQNPNDSSADRQGGVYISDPGLFGIDAAASGAVLYLNAKGALRRVAEDLRYPNGVFYDPTGPYLFVSEHLARRVLRFPVLEDGALGPAETFADIDTAAGRVGDYAEAGPDGLERGPDGDLYVALYGEGRIVRLNAQGTLVQTIETPMRYVTNLAFAPDGAMVVTGAAQNAWPNQRGAIVLFPAEPAPAHAE